MALLLMANGSVYVARADYDKHKEKRSYQRAFDGEHDDDNRERGRKRSRHRKRSRKHSEHYAKEYLSPVNNQLYIDECGACHFAYQPELLSSESWDRILVGLEDHFGETVELDREAEKTIAEYLQTNSAEHSKAKRAVKIVSSLKNNAPIRISEIPYIRGKHREIGQDVIKRESIGSLSNCLACHVTAEKGIYDDDDVRIPQ